MTFKKRYIVKNAIRKNIPRVINTKKSSNEKGTSETNASYLWKKMYQRMLYWELTVFRSALISYFISHCLSFYIYYFSTGCCDEEVSVEVENQVSNETSRMENQLRTFSNCSLKIIELISIFINIYSGKLNNLKRSNIAY